MTQEFPNNLIIQSQKEAVEGVQNLIEEKGIKKKMLDELQKYSQSIVNYLNDQNNHPEPQRFEPIPLNDEQNDPTPFYEYLLVLEYLESIGLKFAPTVFRYESQNYNVLDDRVSVADYFRLPLFDRTPFLVQLIERLRKFRESQ